jgi:hypothetical protein
VVEDSADAGLEEALLEGLSCPISFQLMTAPVMADDGHTYQRPVIQQWIDKCTAGEPPTTGEASPNSCLMCVMHDADRVCAVLICVCMVQTGGRSRLHSQGPRWGRASSPISLSDLCSATLYARTLRRPKEMCHFALRVEGGCPSKTRKHQVVLPQIGLTGTAK